MFKEPKGKHLSMLPILPLIARLNKQQVYIIAKNLRSSITELNKLRKEL